MTGASSGWCSDAVRGPIRMGMGESLRGVTTVGDDWDWGVRIAANATPKLYGYPYG